MWIKTAVNTQGTELDSATTKNVGDVIRFYYEHPEIQLKLFTNRMVMFNVILV